MLHEIVNAVGKALEVILPFDCMQFTFIQKALIGLLLITPLAAITGVQVVNSRMAFFSDAIGHSAFAGVAFGLLFVVSPNLTMPLLALVVGLAIMALRRGTRLSSDTVIGVIFSAVVAFGMAVVSRNKSLARDAQMFLYGDILTIDDTQIILLVLLFIAFAVFQFFAYNRLLCISVNPQLASVHRIRVGLYQYMFAALLSLVVIFSVRAIGVILVTALLVVPAATARNIANNTRSMFFLALATGLFSAVAGLLISVQDWVETATGATIVLVSCVLFTISLVVSLLKGGKTSDTEK